MVSWSEFAVADPELAASIKALIYQYGPGLGYLATVRADGGPRVHPISPVIIAGGLYCFVLDSPKRRDLERDGRYALHSFPAESGESGAYLSGRAVQVTDARRIDRLAKVSRADPRVDWRLFELGVDVATLVCRVAIPAAPAGGQRTFPVRRVWCAETAERRGVPAGQGRCTGAADRIE